MNTNDRTEIIPLPTYPSPNTRLSPPPAAGGIREVAVFTGLIFDYFHQHKHRCNFIFALTNYKSV